MLKDKMSRLPRMDLSPAKGQLTVWERWVHLRAMIGPVVHTQPSPFLRSLSVLQKTCRRADMLYVLRLSTRSVHHALMCTQVYMQVLW